jgi:hypothetical protein
MKVTELINKLAAVQEEHGNIDVLKFDHRVGYLGLRPDVVELRRNVYTSDLGVKRIAEAGSKVVRL